MESGFGRGRWHAWTPRPNYWVARIPQEDGGLTATATDMMPQPEFESKVCCVKTLLSEGDCVHAGALGGPASTAPGRCMGAPAVPVKDSKLPAEPLQVFLAAPAGRHSIAARGIWCFRSACGANAAFFALTSYDENWLRLPDLNRRP